MESLAFNNNNNNNNNNHFTNAFLEIQYFTVRGLVK